MDDDVDYLSPTFDPTSLTIPRLRSIFVAHEIYYPSSAKKSDLIAIFNDKVVPHARRLLSARSRVKPSARGIEDVPSSQEASVQGDDDGGPVEYGRAAKTPRSRRVVARPSTARTSRARDVTATTTADEDDEEENVESAAARTKSVGRKSRKSVLAVPLVKSEEENERGHERERLGMSILLDGESPFTDDNPFQSGSSPPEVMPVRSPSGRVRRSAPAAGSGELRDRRKSTTRRHTEELGGGAVANEALTRSPRKSAVRVKKEPSPEVDGTIAAGEEFTAEEQAELDELVEENAQLDVRPPKRQRRNQHTSGIMKVAPWAFSLAMLGGLGTVWRQEKLQVGFCGVGEASTQIAGVEIPEWASAIQPQCEPCPPHAFCYKDLRIVCEPDFVEVVHPLSLGGVVPLASTCEPDGEKARKVKAVADRAVEQLRDRNAKYECGDLQTTDGKAVKSAEIPEAALKEEIASKRRRGMSQEEFDELWGSAMDEVMSRDEVVSNTDGATATRHHRTLRSTSLAHIPYTCAIRRSLRLALVRHLRQLIPLILIILAAVYARFALRERATLERRAKHLASVALDRLATQAALAEGGEGAVETYIAMGQLRDDVLREEDNAGRRRRLWEKVQAKVEANSNVRSSVRPSRTGEVSRAWEWIGSTAGLLEDGVTVGKRRAGGRYSVGGRGAIEGGVGSPGQSEMVELRHWNEGRPIF